MRKLLSLILVLALIFSATPAFALQCKDGNQWGPDECWTDVYLTLNDQLLGSAAAFSTGTVVIVSSGFATLASNDGFTVRRTTSSLDFGTIGVLQRDYASTDLPAWGRALVRGRGQVKIQGTADDAIAAGDILVLKTSTGYQGIVGENLAATDVRNGVATKVGQALEADTGSVNELIWADIDLL